jgi:antitoxin YefM
VKTRKSEVRIVAGDIRVNYYYRSTSGNGGSNAPADHLNTSAATLIVFSPLAIILAMADTLSLAAVKDRFSEIVERVNKQHDRVIVTRNGVPAVVVVSVEELESLEETLEVLSDRDTVAALRESEQQIAKGLDEVITEDNARARWIR